MTTKVSPSMMDISALAESLLIQTTPAAMRSTIGAAEASLIGGVFYENDQAVTANYTITSGRNAMSAGPITINTGVTVTVPTGSVWTIV